MSLAPTLWLLLKSYEILTRATGKWDWGDHLHVLEAVAVRASLPDFASFVEGLLLQARHIIRTSYAHPI